MAEKIKVEKAGVKAEVENGVKGIVEQYCQKLREKLPHISVDKKPIEVRTPIRTNYGEIKVIAFRAKNGQKRYGVILKPNGAHPLYNRLLVSSAEELKFLKEIAENINTIEQIAKTVTELNEVTEYEEILEDFEF